MSSGQRQRFGMMALLIGIVISRLGNAQTAAESAPVPELIGEGVISTSDDELGGSPAPDGRTLYFEKSAAPHYLYVLCQSRFENGKWGPPEILPFSGQYRDTDPVLSPDGNTILFASDRPVDGVDPRRFLIWEAHKTASAWTKPELISGVVNSQGSQVFASVAKNGTIYFVSNRRTGEDGYYEIYRSRLENGTYREAEYLQTLNGPNVASFEAFVAPDESLMLIGSFGRTDSRGSSDLYISFPEGNGWGKPINLGRVINTRARDYSPRMSADGKWMYFTSERGLGSEKRDTPLSYREFVTRSGGVMNGLGNLYRIPMAYVMQVASQQRQQTSK